MSRDSRLENPGLHIDVPCRISSASEAAKGNVNLPQLSPVTLANHTDIWAVKFNHVRCLPLFNFGIKCKMRQLPSAINEK